MKCVNDCPSSAIDIDNGTIDITCIHCGHCVAICKEQAVAPDFGEIKPLAESHISALDFETLSASIRSCRSYSKKEIPGDILQALVENMKHYPSASNARKVKIAIVKTPEKIQQLNDETANTLIKTLNMVTSPLIKPIVKVFVPQLNIDSLVHYKAKFIKRQKTHTSQVCYNAPAVILFYAPKSKLEMHSSDAFIWATYTSIFAKTLGLGTCFNGFIVKAMGQNNNLRKDFGIPENQQVFTALLLGYPKGNYSNETSRVAPEVTYI